MALQWGVEAVPVFAVPNQETVAEKRKKMAAAISFAPTAWAARRRGRSSSLLLPLVWRLASGV